MAGSFVALDRAAGFDVLLVGAAVGGGGDPAGSDVVVVGGSVGNGGAVCATARELRAVRTHNANAYGRTARPHEARSASSPPTRYDTCVQLGEPRPPSHLKV